MKLRRLRLENFRQHAATDIEFGPGVTGIIGPNGAGKSTILEAIAWAIYGSSAARGTNDTIRFARAPARSRVAVELDFELAGHEYRAVRTLTAAEAFLDGGAAPVATGIGGVTEYLQSRLGMTREEFFNTYFTGQKELQFLARMGPTQRGRFLSQVLGYERLRLAQERARQRRNALRHEAEGLRSALPDPKALRAASESAEQRLGEARAELDTAVEALATATAVLDAVRPRWDAAQTARERARALEHQIGLADQTRESAERDAARIAGELERVVAAESRLEPVRADLRVLPAVVAANERHAELRRIEERRRALAEREAELVKEIEDAAARTKALEQAPELVKQAESVLAEQRAALETLETRIQGLQGQWVQSRQDVKTRLQTYLDHARDLKEQLEQLREAGPDGVCPTCARPLGGEFESVVGRLEDELQVVVQDGKWLRQREHQLEGRPEDLVSEEAKRAQLLGAIEQQRERHGRCVTASHELGVLVQEAARRGDALDALRKELAALPDGYDAEAHRRDEARLTELRALEREAAGLEQVVAARATLETELAGAHRATAEAGERIVALEQAHAALDVDEASFQALRSEHEHASDEARRAELRASELRGVVATAELALENARRDEAEDRERRARLDDLETEVRHHNELDTGFSQLRQELNARVRPELAELASSFLTQITDGRYTGLEIDDDYNVLVLDEGEEKPVISGGEEDVANLVLRVAISQMIADRSGHPLSILVLDEVFGSLDVDRRENVIGLLHGLSDRFEQVILITHIETVRDGLDRIIRVSYDERSGASVVVEDDGPALQAGNPYLEANPSQAW